MLIFSLHTVVSVHLVKCEWVRLSGCRDTQSAQCHCALVRCPFIQSITFSGAPIEFPCWAVSGLQRASSFEAVLLFPGHLQSNKPASYANPPLPICNFFVARNYISHDASVLLMNPSHSVISSVSHCELMSKRVNKLMKYRSRSPSLIAWRVRMRPIMPRVAPWSGSLAQR